MSKEYVLDDFTAQSNLLIEHANESLNKVEKVPNPFTYPGKWSLWEVFKFIPGIVIIPLRMISIFLCVLFASLISKLSMAFGWDGTPMKGLRLFILQLNTYICRLCLFCYGFMWVNVKGKPCKNTEANIVVVSPHSTVVDTLYIMYSYNFPRTVSKAENGTVCLFGSIFQAMSTIFVDRNSADAKTQALENLKAGALEPNSRHIVIYPEGTCGNRKRLLKFKRGAFYPGLPIQPVITRFPHKHFDPTWTSGGPNRMFLIIRLISQFFNRMEVEFLDVYHPSEEEKADAELYAENVRQVMAEKLDIPGSEHTYPDVFFAKTAKKLGVHPEAAMPYELATLKLKVDECPSQSELKAYLARFRSCDPRSAQMSYRTFAKSVLGVPTINKGAQALFDQLCTTPGMDSDDESSKEKKLHYINYALGVGAIKKAQTPEAIDAVFHALDHDDSNTIDLKDVEKCIARSPIKRIEPIKKSAEKMFRRMIRAQKSDKPMNEINRTEFGTFVEQYPEQMYVIAVTLGKL